MTQYDLEEGSYPVKGETIVSIKSSIQINSYFRVASILNFTPIPVFVLSILGGTSLSLRLPGSSTVCIIRDILHFNELLVIY